MYVRNYMTSNPFVIKPDDSVGVTMELVREKKIRKLPVMRDGKLVGIVTEKQLLEVSPSKATTLSIYEINHLLSKTKIESVMSKNVITAHPETLIEEAALLLREHRIGALPVLDNGKLVGIITESDIFNAFIEIMGYKDPGSRIIIALGEDHPGTLAKLAKIVADLNINILHLVINNNEIVFRINTKNSDELLKNLEQSNFNVTAVNTNQ